MNGKPLRCNAWAKPRRCVYIYIYTYIHIIYIYRLYILYIYIQIIYIYIYSYIYIYILYIYILFIYTYYLYIHIIYYIYICAQMIHIDSHKQNIHESMQYAISPCYRIKYYVSFLFYKMQMYHTCMVWKVHEFHISFKTLGFGVFHRYLSMCLSIYQCISIYFYLLYLYISGSICIYLSI